MRQYLLLYLVTLITINWTNGLGAETVSGPITGPMNGPMIGHTDDQSTRIWFGYHSPATLRVAIGHKPDLSDARLVSGPELEEASGFVGTVYIDGLKPDSTYHYAIELNGNRLGQTPFASFKTAPPAGQSAPIRIAFSSCNGKTGRQAADSWAQLKRTGHADIMLQLGDNHYGNSTNPIKVRQAYAGHRTHPTFQAVASRIPIYGIWDDHDYGTNNSDRTMNGKEDGLRVFKQHWPNPAAGEARNPGTYYSFARNGVRFIALDGRYYRDPNKSPESPTKTFLGKRQKQWLKMRLRQTREKVKIIMCGSQLQLNGSVDSFSSFKVEQREILDFIKDHDIQGVLFLSGDRHFSAAYQIDGRVIEITASPMGSRNGKTGPLPDMFLAHTTGKQFAVLDIDPTQNPPKIILEFHEGGKGIVQKRELTWDEINGKKRIEPMK